MDTMIWGNTLAAYVWTALFSAMAFISIKVFKKIGIHQLKNFAEKSSNLLDDWLIDLIESKVLPSAYVIALCLPIKHLNLSESLAKALHSLLWIVFSVAIIRVFIAVLSTLLQQYWAKSNSSDAHEKSLHGILFVLRFLTWSLGTILVLDNLGFQVSSVVAGLGIGGIAVALAAQTILGDLFSYVAILFDRPFIVGDFLIVGDLMGTVENIGIKTTRVRSLSGEQLIFSNNDLTNSRIRNFKRMETRRVVFKLGLTYQTSLEEIKKAPEIVKSIIESTPSTRFDRSHFASFGDFSLNLEAVYYVLSSDYNVYMDIQQDINFKVKEAFEKEGLDFAYPTQTLFVAK